ERAKVADFAPPYYLYEFTYLVPAGSAIQNQSEVDRSGVRIAVAEGSVTARDREQALKLAKLKRFKTLPEIRGQLVAANVDAAAGGAKLWRASLPSCLAHACWTAPSPSTGLPSRCRRVDRKRLPT